LLGCKKIIFYGAAKYAFSCPELTTKNKISYQTTKASERIGAILIPLGV
jgi:hypothetical protein